jgi:hypothetical protein
VSPVGWCRRGKGERSWRGRAGGGRGLEGRLKEEERGGKRREKEKGEKGKEKGKKRKKENRKRKIREEK